MKSIILNISVIIVSILLYNAAIYLADRMPIPFGVAIPIILLIILLGKSYPAFYQLLPFAPSNILVCYILSVSILIANEYSFYCFRCLSTDSAQQKESLYRALLHYGAWTIAWMTVLFFVIRVTYKKEPKTKT